MNEPLAYLNGQFLPAAEASISLTDAGFVLGATVAEQVRTIGGKPFRLQDHLARLMHSLAIVEVDPLMTVEQLAGVGEQLVDNNFRLVDRHDDLGLAIFVTPGIYGAYAAGGPPRPTVCLHTYRLPFGLWAEKYSRGEALVTTDVEQVSPRSWPADLKCRSRMHYYLADRRASRIDPDSRALLLDRRGFVTEASTANVLVYRRAEGLLSPPESKVLPGISLATALELAEQLGIPTAGRELTVDDVAGADEVLLTSTPFCLLPVTRFNRRDVGGGVPGDVFSRLLAAWSERVGLDVAAQAVRFAQRG
ncbi:MAG: aminotransferase class IV [Planctomycetes bacterium]|nr:aminotransferase class IV [Planctomycetota bacterium]